MHNEIIRSDKGKNMVFLAMIVIVILILLAALYSYCIAFYSPKKKRCSIDDPLIGSQYEMFSEHIYRISHIMERIPFEAVTIQSFDKCSLFGRYYHVKDGAPIEIMFHGYRSCAFRDCSGAHALSRKMGFNALVVDQRAHGKSGGKTISFGINEGRDCICWINYLNKRFGAATPIILSGLSMGAATVLMATGLELPDNVACVIADSPYSTPSAIIEKVCTDLRYPVTLCRPFLHLGAQLFGNFQLDSLTAKSAVSKSTIPILLLHGEDDRLVPYSMSFEIAASSPSNVYVRTFPNAGHGLSYMVDPLRYERIIYEFLLQIAGIGENISESFRNQISG